MGDLEANIQDAVAAAVQLGCHQLLNATAAATLSVATFALASQFLLTCDCKISFGEGSEYGWLPAAGGPNDRWALSIVNKASFCACLS